ncbi:unnamed protein product [Gordionus sp. m RMFG-2023]
MYDSNNSMIPNDNYDGSLRFSSINRKNDHIYIKTLMDIEKNHHPNNIKSPNKKSTKIYKHHYWCFKFKVESLFEQNFTKLLVNNIAIISLLISGLICVSLIPIFYYHLDGIATRHRNVLKVLKQKMEQKQRTMEYIAIQIQDIQKQLSDSQKFSTNIESIQQESSVVTKLSETKTQDTHSIGKRDTYGRPVSPYNYKSGLVCKVCKMGYKGPIGPKGEDGLPGRNGALGFNGKDGSVGNDGKLGASGLHGKMGFPGPPGIPGIPGRDGKPGVSGSRGNDGSPGKDGEDGINISEQGKPGEQGKMGKNGNMGFSGRTGEPGWAGRPGRDAQPGEPGLRGRPGPPGKDGKPGNNGNDGYDGKLGPNGLPGKIGKTGRPGSKGIGGLPGQNGRPGKKGPPGNNGKNGKDGLPGKNGIDGEDGTTVYFTIYL